MAFFGGENALKMAFLGGQLLKNGILGEKRSQNGKFWVGELSENGILGGKVSENGIFGVKAV